MTNDNARYGEGLPKFPQEEAHINSAIEALLNAVEYLKQGNYPKAMSDIEEAKDNIFVSKQEPLSPDEMKELWKQTFVLKEEYDSLKAQLDAERGRVAMLREVLEKIQTKADNFIPPISHADYNAGYQAGLQDCGFIAKEALQANAADWLAGQKAEAVAQMLPVVEAVGRHINEYANWAEVREAYQRYIEQSSEVRCER